MGAFVRACALFVVVGAAACGGDGAPAVDGPPGGDGDAALTDTPVDSNPNMPATLQETGLCSDPACATIASDVRLYAPRFELYSDGATKRRWIYLPAGEQIDTTDMNHWVFPVGTKLWKEFTRDGVRVETRLVMKVLPDDNMAGAWIMLTYGWNTAQDAAILVGTGGEENANGTMHDIPSRQGCRDCHNGVRPTRVLGFGAVSLDFDAPADSVDLADLVEWGLLSAPPAGAASPFFPLPGTQVDEAALGYLHANCGHCHNPSNPNNAVPLNLRLRTEASARATVAATPAYQTTVNQTGSPFVEDGTTYTTIVVPNMPDQSILSRRMLSTNLGVKMPRLGTEVADPDGQTKLRAWINSL
jgi:hypothetical protein